MWLITSTNYPNFLLIKFHVGLSYIDFHPWINQISFLRQNIRVVEDGEKSAEKKPEESIRNR